MNNRCYLFLELLELEIGNHLEVKRRDFDGEEINKEEL